MAILFSLFILLYPTSSHSTALYLHSTLNLPSHYRYFTFTPMHTTPHSTTLYPTRPLYHTQLHSSFTLPPPTLSYFTSPLLYYILLYPTLPLLYPYFTKAAILPHSVTLYPTLLYSYLLYFTHSTPLFSHSIAFYPDVPYSTLLYVLLISLLVFVTVTMVTCAILKCF